MRRRAKADGVKLILLERVVRLGSVGDVVTVRPGFARNYLVPQGKALKYSESVAAAFHSKKEHYLSLHEERMEKALLLHERVNGIELEIVRSASVTGVLFGSVTGRDIIQGILDSFGGVERLDKGSIVLSNPIKSLGLHRISVMLTADCDTVVDVYVGRSVEEIKEMKAKKRDGLEVLSFDSYGNDDYMAVSEISSSEAEADQANIDSGSDTEVATA